MACPRNVVVLLWVSLVLLLELLKPYCLTSANRGLWLDEYM